MSSQANPDEAVLDKAFVLNDIHVLQGGKITMAKRGECVKYHGTGGLGFLEGGKVYHEKGFSLMYALVSGGSAFPDMMFLVPDSAMGGPFDDEEVKKLYLLVDPAAFDQDAEVELLNPGTGDVQRVSTALLREQLGGQELDLAETYFVFEGGAWLWSSAV